MSETLTSHAQRWLEWADRSRRVFAALGIGDMERGLIITLVREPGPWAVTDMAEYIGCNRTTLYRRLVAREQQGLTRRVGKKWVCTAQGRADAIRILNEVAAVIAGVQGALSEDVIQLCVEINPNTRADEARLITFRHSKLSL